MDYANVGYTTVHDSSLFSDCLGRMVHIVPREHSQGIGIDILDPESVNHFFRASSPHEYALKPDQSYSFLCYISRLVQSGWLHHAANAELSSIAYTDRGLVSSPLSRTSSINFIPNANLTRYES